MSDSDEEIFCDGLPPMVNDYMENPIEILTQMIGKPSILNLPIDDMTLDDLHEETMWITEDFKRIFSMEGGACAALAIPRIVRILRYLEVELKSKEEKEKKFSIMKDRLERLEEDTIERRNLREQFDEELAWMEEDYGKQINDLKSELVKLQTELAEKSKSDSKKVVEQKFVVVAREKKVENRAVAEHDQETIKSMKEKNRQLESEVEKLIKKFEEQTSQMKSEMKTLNKNLDERNEELLLIQRESEKSDSVRNGLRQRVTAMTERVQIVTNEKVDLEVQIKEQESSIRKLKQIIIERIPMHELPKELFTEEEKIDDTEPQFSLYEMRQIIAERNKYKSRSMEFEDEIAALKQELTKVNSLKNKALEKSTHTQGTRKSWFRFGSSNNTNEKSNTASSNSSNSADYRSS